MRSLEYESFHRTKNLQDHTLITSSVAPNVVNCWPVCNSKQLKIVSVNLLLNFISSPTWYISTVSLESKANQQNLSMDVLLLCTASGYYNICTKWQVRAAESHTRSHALGSAPVIMILVIMIPVNNAWIFVFTQRLKQLHTLQFEIIGWGERGWRVHIERGCLKIAVQSGNPLSQIMRVALSKSRSERGVSHQPAFMGSCLTISHRCLPLLHLW